MAYGKRYWQSIPGDGFNLVQAVFTVFSALIYSFSTAFHIPGRLMLSIEALACILTIARSFDDGLLLPVA